MDWPLKSALIIIKNEYLLGTLLALKAWGAKFIHNLNCSLNPEHSTNGEKKPFYWRKKAVLLWFESAYFSNSTLLVHSIKTNSPQNQTIKRAF